MRNKTGVKHNEEGFASIVIALVIVIVLSLITVGFAQLARQEQQDALSKQLADQAYYAAESGVNDVVKAIPALRAQKIADASKVDPNKCLDLPAILPNTSINRQADVSYSCALVDLDPDSIVYSGISDRSSRYVTFGTVGAAGAGGLDRFTISWGSKSGKAPRTNGPNVDGSWNFAAKDDWNAPGVVQLSITKLYNGTYTRDSLRSNTFTAYLYPTTNTSQPNSVPFTPALEDQAPVVPGHCAATGTYPCKAQITGLSGDVNDIYLVRILNYYDTIDLSINNAKDIGSRPLEFKDGQAQVDVTGKAKNVLKRIQVRVPLKPSTAMPEFAIESQSTCKRFSGWPTTAHAPAPLTDFDAASPSCALVP